MGGPPPAARPDRSRTVPAFRPTCWGGEEFLVVLADTSPEYATEFARKIRAAVERMQVEVGRGQVVGVTASVGLVCYPPSDTPQRFSFEQCINLSDAALAKAKLLGRNRSVQLVPQRAVGYDELLGELDRLSVSELETKSSVLRLVE